MVGKRRQRRRACWSRWAGRGCNDQAQHMHLAQGLLSQKWGHQCTAHAAQPLSLAAAGESHMCRSVVLNWQTHQPTKQSKLTLPLCSHYHIAACASTAAGRHIVAAFQAKRTSPRRGPTMPKRRGGGKGGPKAASKRALGMSLVRNKRKQQLARRAAAKDG